MWHVDFKRPLCVHAGQRLCKLEINENVLYFVAIQSNGSDGKDETSAVWWN